MVQYDLDLQTSQEFDKHTFKFILDPNQWASLVLPFTLNWNAVPFHESNATHIPDNAIGVYSFIVKPSIAKHDDCAYLMYIGQTKRQTFRLRYQQYLRDQRTRKGRYPVVNMLNTWPNQLWFCYAPIKEFTNIDEVENRLLSAFLPPINRQFPADVRGPMNLWRM